MKYTDMEDKKKFSPFGWRISNSKTKKESPPSSNFLRYETEIADVANQGDYDLLIGLKSILKALF
jgi:hypothetical protein